MGVALSLSERTLHPVCYDVDMIQTLDPTERTDRNWAIAAHLSALVAVAGIPFGHVVGPLVVYLLTSQKRPFANEHAKASLNFQITLSIGIVLLLIALGAATVGFVATASKTPDASPPVSAFAGLFAVIILLVFTGVWALVGIIRGAVAANEGRAYRYPFAINFLK